MLRFAGLLYGIACYAVFLGTILYAIGFVSGLIVPKTIDTGPIVPLAEAIPINIMLMLVFAVQHSVMARRQFKDWWTRIVPKHIERSTYVLFSSLALILLFWQWRPIEATIWSIDQPTLANALVALSLIGWLLVFTSTFLINHFELFGLMQVVDHIAGNETAAPTFRTPLFYRALRHPIYLGFIIAFWATPHMSAGHLLFAAVTTAYIFAGIALEERDLVEMFGDEYRRYKARVPMLFPWMVASAGEASGEPSPPPRPYTRRE